MEINALFDLWDVFAARMTTFTDHLQEPFHHFPAGTPCTEVIEWFDKQNPFFTVVDHGDKELPKYTIIRTTASDQDDSEEPNHEPTPPRPAIA